MKKIIIAIVVLASLTAVHADDVPIPSALAVPRMQVIPLPQHQASIQRDGVEITRYYFDPAQERTFCYPIIGPSGRSLTRMGHPNDPVGHSHHNSVWVSHQDVGGANSWADNGGGRIVHDHIVRYVDGEDEAAILTTNKWLDKSGKPIVLERRAIRAVSTDDSGEWMMIVDIQIEPAGKEPVTIGKSAFGLLGVRMAKTISVRFGGGLIRNSEGNVCKLPDPLPEPTKIEGSVDNAENSTFRKHARWCDYSGAILTGVNEGITLMDHPQNPHHPTAFHTRSDGWMCASLTLDEPVTLEPGKLMKLRYALWMHAGVPDAKTIEAQWQKFAATAVDELPTKR